MPERPGSARRPLPVRGVQPPPRAVHLIGPAIEKGGHHFAAPPPSFTVRPGSSVRTRRPDYDFFFFPNFRFMSATWRLLSPVRTFSA